MYKGEKETMDYLGKAGKAGMEDIAKAIGMNVDTVRRAVEALKESGHVSLTATEKETFEITPEASAYLGKKELPEAGVYAKAVAGSAIDKLGPGEKQFGLSWARKKGFISIENGRIVPKKEKGEVEEDQRGLLAALQQVKDGKTPSARELLDELETRKLVIKSIRRAVAVELTGKAFKAEEGFDISTETKFAEMGKNHPLTKLMNKIKTVFTEIGFEEMQGGLVESSFWNFDALFQPQDHPARELADTFYIKGEGQLPDADLVRRVKQAHEKSWKYEWKESEAKKLVLRTHTTALSARYLAALKNSREGKKYFAIGRVFRNEATDYSHLAEFHQVEGIISWENASFRDLLGILREFYSRLGFEKVRFRPSYFPYTEPSLEVEIYYEPKKTWLEIGGAGIFRPEVSIPLCNSYPVLAWGLSLERPAMLMLGVDDIRTFYRNDMNFLKSAILKV